MSKNSPVPLTFDYKGLDTETRRQLEREAAAIRKHLFQVKTSAIQLGHHLLKVKALLPRRFGEWVGSNCDFTSRTAELFMRAAEFAESHESIAQKVSQTALFQISAPRLGDEVREKLVDAVEKGEVRSSAEIKEVIARQSIKSDGRGQGEAEGALLEIASILIENLAETNLDRVRSLASSLEKTSVASLANALMPPNFRPLRVSSHGLD